MNGLILLVCALLYFALGYKFYGGFIARLFKVDNSIPTPAVVNQDGVDYVPTHPGVLFGHHFASIAGAGPIIGPIVACQFGWLPALLWIFIGCVFIGAMHDFAALFLSVRNNGRSIGYIIEKIMSIWGRQLFLFFCWACLILVVAVFGTLVANTFVSNPAVATASIIFILMAPVFGFVTSKGVSLRTASIIFVPLVFVSVYVAYKFPLDLGALFGLEKEGVRNVWLAFLGIYALVASVCPVQWLLQPRDYLSSYLLYAMIILGVLGIVVYNPSIEMSDFTGFVVDNGTSRSSLFPDLFILIACGACSGFHSLVSSGTTSKQIRAEKDIQLIGYGGMIVEGVLGVMSLIAVIWLSDVSFAEAVKNPVTAFSSGIGTFVGALGLPVELCTVFISLSISAFMLTSLDTATRLGRFVWQELFSPSYTRQQNKDNGNEKQKIDFVAPRKKHGAVMDAMLGVIGVVRKFSANAFMASLLVLLLAGLMVFSGSATAIWPVFGASNQLLASLTLLAVTIYLFARKSHYLIALIPTVLMIVMSIWGLVEIAAKYFSTNSVLTVSSIFLIFMALMLVLLSLTIVIRTIRYRV
jgi:carbon starvation protein